MTLTVGSLFSGIGGIDLGLERAGMTVKWHSEIDPYACRVLKKHWPHVPNLGNIKEINWKETEKVDVICGGYPCQPFSTAGKRNGEEDPRHLWPWVRQAIGELRPQYAILENVRGHLSLGGLSVIGELASIGYDAEWRVVSAASVGANHKRDRIVIVAYPSELFSNGGDNNSRVGMESETIPKLGDSGRSTDVAYANSLDPSDGRQCSSLPCQSRSRRDDGAGSGSDPRQVSVEGTRETPSDVANSNPREDGWRNGSVQQGSGLVFGRENIGRRTQEYAGWQWWQVEPNVGRVAHGVPSRVDRLRGLGNAVVPQVAEIVGRLIMEAHSEHL
jgi:DNA (cytosine-5)-methyltransferase 1